MMHFHEAFSFLFSMFQALVEQRIYFCLGRDTFTLSILFISINRPPLYVEQRKEENKFVIIIDGETEIHYVIV